MIKFFLFLLLQISFCFCEHPHASLERHQQNVTMGTGIPSSWGLSAAQACGQTAVVTTTAAGVTTTSTIYATTTGAIIGGMTEGAVIALSTSAALAVLSCNGDLREAFKTLCSNQNIKSMIIQAMAHGIMNGAIQQFELPRLLLNRTFTENLAVYGSKAAGYVGAKAIFYGSDAFKDLHKEVAQVVIQSFCADLCKSIGAAYKSVDALGNIVDGKLDYFSHKLMHGFVGALGGAVHGVDGMAAGATGAAFGEVLGEMVLNNPAMLQKMRDLHQQGVDQSTILKEHVDVKAFLVKLTAAVGSGLFGLDTQIAYDSADRAIENNCLGYILAALAGAYLSLSSVYQGYIDGGTEGMLKAAGIEIVWTAAGFGIGKAGVKVISHYRVGDKVCTTLKEATTYACQKFPKLAIALDVLGDKLLAYEMAYSQSTLGKGLKAFEDAVAKAHNGVKDGLSRMFGKNGVTKAEVEALKELGNTNYSRKFVSGSGKFHNEPVVWTSPTGTQQTYKVYQRTDIDWNKVRTVGDKRFIGKTNAEAARAGFAPELSDGYSATLHHINQNGKGSLVEASRRYHGFGKEGHDILHRIWGKGMGHPNNPVDRMLFQKDFSAYWKQRIGAVQ